MKKIIVANWKMNPSTATEARRLFETVKKKARNLKKAEVVIAPPFVYLPFFTSSSTLKLGAQDVFFKDSLAGGGAYTGEVSPSMLKDLGVSYVLVGHSERRENLGETDELIHKKLQAAVARGLKAILCVGEKERTKDAFPPVVRDELKKALKGIPRRLYARTIIAYEPIWAISTHSGGRSDTPQDFFEMSIFIRRTILDIWGKSAALRIPILYGGSVNSRNARSFLEVKGIGGLLVGRASLKPEEFLKILDETKSI